MRTQAQRMNSLIRDLIVLSALEVDTEPKAHEHVLLKPLLEDIRQNAMEAAKGVRNIQVQCDPQLTYFANRTIATDIQQSDSSAVKYTEENGVIKILCVNEPSEMQFNVEDNGIGIDPVHIPRLTERFYRVDAGRSIERGGTGLGLAIVKHALRGYGGRLLISSKPFKGSKFTCVLPHHTN